MPTIKIAIKTYSRLQELMANELNKQLQQATDKKKAMLQLVKNKFGITYDVMVCKLIDNYKIK